MSKQFTVPIILPADPAAPMEAATKQYVDAQSGGGPGTETEVHVGPTDPTATSPLTELWVDTSAPGLMGDTEVYVGPEDPIASYPGTELWVDTDAVSSLTGYNMRGAWAADTVYYKGDVVNLHWYAYWYWNSATPCPVNVQPGMSNSGWELVGGTPIMTDAAITNFTSVRNGNTVYATDRGRHLTYYSGWKVAGFTFVSNVSITQYGTAINDATPRNMFTYTVQQTSTCLVTGRFSFNHTASGTTEFRQHLYRQNPPGTTLSQPNGGANQITTGTTTTGLAWNFSAVINCNPGEVIVLEHHRQSGAGTWTVNMTDARFNGATITEFPRH